MTKPILLSSSVFSEAEGLLFTTRVQIFSAHTRDIKKKKKFKLVPYFLFSVNSSMFKKYFANRLLVLGLILTWSHEFKHSVCFFM